MASSARSDSSRDSSNKHSTMVVAIVAIAALVAMFIALPGQSNQAGFSDISGNPVRDGEGAAGPGGATPTLVRPDSRRVGLDLTQQSAVTWPTPAAQITALSLPYQERFGQMADRSTPLYCLNSTNMPLSLFRKDDNFCQFGARTGVRPHANKTVGRFVVFNMPNSWQHPTTGVTSLAVDVAKVAGSGTGDVGFHIFYSSFPTPGETALNSWKWAQYCVLPRAQATMTCTKNFARSVSVGKVMVARANFGVSASTPYVTDIRATT